MDLFMIGCGGFLWILSCIVGFQRVRLYLVGWRTQGTVVDVLEGHWGTMEFGGSIHAGKPARLPEIEFVDEGTGRLVHFRTTIGTSATKLVVGEKVPVRYVSGNEYLAEIDGPFNLFGFPLLSFLVGAVFLGVWWIWMHGG